VAQQENSALAGAVSGDQPALDAPVPPLRRRRSDATRNVAAVVEAARSVFTTRGVDAPAKEITDLAGVGVGTLYRHFPRRSDLILAVLQTDLDACTRTAAHLSTTLPPREALLAWLEEYQDLVTTKHGLAAALHSGDPAYEGLPQRMLDRLEPCLQSLMDTAASAGALGEVITARELLVGIALLFQPVPGQGPDLNRRLVLLLVEGMLHTLT
jgi:AcrR family transcriptional regulator